MSEVFHVSQPLQCCIGDYQRVHSIAAFRSDLPNNAAMNSRAKDKILEDLRLLISQGTSVRSSINTLLEQSLSLPLYEIHRFWTAGRALLESIAGRESEFYRAAVKGINAPSAGLSSPTDKLLGALGALHQAIERGWLASYEQQLRANVHDDFMSQANDLLDQGYHVAAMVMYGGVLEDHIRTLCSAHAISWSGDPGIANYNTALFKANLVDKATWRQIQVVGDLRNQAAHGHGRAITQEQVAEQRIFISRVLAERPHMI